MDAMPRLLDRVRDHLRKLHYSYRTEQQYLFWIRRFILFHGKRHPSDMAAREVEDFLTHLAVDRKVSASTRNQALAAILFLYQKVMQVELPWLVGNLLYGAGLRLNEALQLHLENVKLRHESALRNGHAGAELPFALERKYPNAYLEWGWQYVFPAERPSHDKRSSAVTTYAPCRNCSDTRM
jgi:Phage integrase, N-terminal SAM-like domain